MAAGDIPYDTLVSSLDATGPTGAGEKGGQRSGPDFCETWPALRGGRDGHRCVQPCFPAGKPTSPVRTSASVPARRASGNDRPLL